MSCLRLAVGFACVFVVAVSSNIFATAMWDRVVNLGGVSTLSVGEAATTLVLSLAAFTAAASWLYYEAHRILDVQFVVGSVEPRPVLITGLSALSTAQLATARALIQRVQRECLSMNDLAGSPREVTERFCPEVAALPWVQNVRALWSLHERLELLMVVPSDQSVTQFDTFRALIEALVANTAELASRGVAVVSSGDGVDYTTHEPIRVGLTEAFRAIRVQLGTSSIYTRYGEGDVTLDMTPGTKAFSVAIVLSSLGSAGRCLYVDNNGKSQGVNCLVRLAGGLR